MSSACVTQVSPVSSNTSELSLKTEKGQYLTGANFTHLIDTEQLPDVLHVLLLCLLQT